MKLIKKVILILFLFINISQSSYIKEYKVSDKIIINIKDNKIKITNNSDKNYIFSHIDINYKKDNYNKIKVYRSYYSEPLMYLYDGETLSDKELNNKSLNSRLKLFNYSNISNLDEYIIEYINKNYEKNYKKISDMDIEYLDKIFNTPSSIEETNSEIKEAYYKYLLENIKININNEMKYKIINKGESIIVNTDYLNKFNYQDDIQIIINFKENTEYGKVKIYYIDHEGNYLIKPITISNLLGTQYETNSIDINNYKLIKSTNNNKGIIKEDEQFVYYLYEELI